MKISVIGCGYLGAVHAAAMAELGHDVIGIDTDAHKVGQLLAGTAPFFEPGLDELLASALASGRLRFSTEMAAVAGAEAHFIAVGTPLKPASDSLDLSYVEAAVEALLPHLAEGDLVVGKSTVPVGTAARLAEMMDAAGSAATLVWNPEFLREGHAVNDTLNPDRLVYGVAAGAAGERASTVLNEVYAAAIERGTPLVVTNYSTAELVKVAANAFLATKISFINAIAEVAEATGADIGQLADAIGHDDRIGRKFLNAGVGFGGGCLPKDIRGFIARSEELGLADSMGFLKEVDAINHRRRKKVVDLAIDALGSDLVGKKVAVLGLSFKPHSDDVRDSPALDVATQLWSRGAVVSATDPRAIEGARKRNEHLSYRSSVEETLTGAEVVILLTEWPEFVGIDPVWAATLVKNRTIIDGRNALDPAVWRAAGWAYKGLGQL